MKTSVVHSLVLLLVSLYTVLGATPVKEYKRHRLLEALAEEKKSLGLENYGVKHVNKRVSEGRVSFRECNIEPGFRENCGYQGMTQMECYGRGCCWSADDSTCYHSEPAMGPMCALAEEERTLCGFGGIRKESCLYKGCCWKPTQFVNDVWCFNKMRVPVFDDECGRPAISPSVHGHRVVGGTEARPHSWPWMVNLQADGRHFCGGSLINSRWVVSAAHCAPGFTYGMNSSVVVGNHNRFVYEESEMEIDMEGATVIVHPNWDSMNIDNDIMLIRLNEEVTLRDEISPVCLPDPGADYRPGEHCYVTGWGNTQYGGESPDVLLQGKVPLIDNHFCNTELYVGEITENMICAGYEEGGRGACHGDSGGALVCRGSDPATWILTGVVSWGYGCAGEDQPGVYAKVSNYITWIETTIAENS